MTQDPVPALVLSGHLAAMGAIRCFGAAGLPVVNVYYADSDFSHTSRYVRDRVRSPHPEHDEQGFVEALVDCARRFGRCLLVPVNDATLGAVSRRKAELEAHHVVACADWSIVEKVIDKKHTYALAHAIGVPAPRTEIPRSKAELEQIAATFTFPCLVKPRESHRYAEVFRAKVARVGNPDELAIEYDRATSAGIGVMVQEYIPGDDTHSFNYNSYRSRGGVIDFTAQKLRLAPPEFGLPRVIMSCDVPEIVAPARRILEALGYTGYSCTEFKLDPRDGVHKLMDVNARLNRSILHPLGCGINFPWIMYRDLVLGEAVSAPERSADPVYWIDLASDVRYSVRGFRSEGHGLAEYLRPYRGRKVFAVGGGLDVMPFLTRSFETVGRRLRKLARGGRPAAGPG
jgi:predicted ATP-grasp superfamily ATP-dependent carboligase